MSSEHVCYVLFVHVTLTEHLLCAACLVWRLLRESFRPGARQCRRRTTPTNGASGRLVLLAMMLFRLKQSSVSVETSKLLSPRPGRRVVISWNSQVLPSGSLNVAKEK